MQKFTTLDIYNCLFSILIMRNLLFIRIRTAI